MALPPCLPTSIPSHPQTLVPSLLFSSLNCLPPFRQLGNLASVELVKLVIPTNPLQHRPRPVYCHIPLHSRLPLSSFNRRITYQPIITHTLARFHLLSGQHHQNFRKHTGSKNPQNWSSDVPPTRIFRIFSEGVLPRDLRTRYSWWHYTSVSISLSPPKFHCTRPFVYSLP